MPCIVWTEVYPKYFLLYSPWARPPTFPGHDVMFVWTSGLFLLLPLFLIITFIIVLTKSLQVL